MVNLITGPKGSGKTQKVVELANEKVKSSDGNVVLIKRSHRHTYSVDFNVRAICMDDYAAIATLDEFVGFLYGMVAGNHDIDTILIDSTLKQADISLDTLPVFLEKLSKISDEHNIDFYISINAANDEIPDIVGNSAYKLLA